MFHRGIAITPSTAVRAMCVSITASCASFSPSTANFTKYGLTAPMGATGTTAAPAKSARSTPRRTTSGTSSGRWSANLLLNVPPDRRGQIFEADALALKTFRDVLDKAMSRDLAQGARVRASSVLSPAFAAENVLTRAQPWAALESDRAGAWITLVLPKAV